MAKTLTQLAAALGLALALGVSPACDSPAFAQAPAAAPAQRLIDEGDALAGAGRLADAEATFRRALTAAEAAYGPRDPRTATAVSRVALAMMAQGRRAEAEPVLRRLAAFYEVSPGPRSAETALALYNLAGAVGAQGRYAEAEAIQRRSLAIDEQALGPEHPSTARDLTQLGELLVLQQRPAQAEPPLRRAVAIYDKAPPGRPTAEALSGLGAALKAQGRLGEAEAVFRRALSLEDGFRPQNPARLGQATNDLGLMLIDRGRGREAEALLRRRLALVEAAPTPDPFLTGAALANLGLVMLAQGRYPEAEALQRRAVAAFEQTGPDTPESATALEGLSASLQAQARFAEAERLLRRAASVYRARLGDDDPKTIRIHTALAGALAAQGQTVAAEALQRQVLAAQQARLSAGDPALSLTLDGLARSLLAQGRAAEAEPLQRRAVAIAEQADKGKGPKLAWRLFTLALIVDAQGRSAEAEPLYRRALGLAQDALGKDHGGVMAVREQLAYVQARAGRYEAAARSFRGGCRRRLRGAVRAGREAVGGAAATDAGLSAAACSQFQATSLYGWARAGGGSEPDDRPQALMAEAFAAAQRASDSVAGEALSRSGARAAAKAAGAEQDAADYEAALALREIADAQFAEAAADPTAAGAEQRQTLAGLRAQLDQAIPPLAAKLAEQHPRYWALRSPQPIGLSALQARIGRDAALLRPDEALIVLAIPAKGNRGLVFAVSKDRSAWAQIAMTGQELRDRVGRLRVQIDPHGYDLRGAARDAGGGDAPRAFDRQSAWEVYQALLGDPAIQAVLKDKPTWLFVPSGAMDSLPPGLLLTAPPTGGVAGDSDPAALRASPWLIRSKAVAVLPTVSALRTLRRGEARPPAPEPLLAFADPDFAGVRSAAAPGLPDFLRPRAAEGYMQDGRGRSDQLATLPRLLGTRAEGLALLAVLGGNQDGLLIGAEATEGELKARNASGRLARARVVEFATHGLLWGDMSLGEPALAFSYPPPGSDPAVDDGLLTASEAAGLTLNAEWAILSACNTAGPGGAGGDGLSGLTAAFLYAGARSVLVSHWTVRDDVPPRLIPTMLSLERDNPALSRAEALRRASLAVMDDPAMDAAHPAAWAPFVLVGEAQR